MNDYIEASYTITPCSEDITDTLAQLLADAGFESFVPSDTGLKAYIPAGSFNPETPDPATLLPFDISFTRTTALIPGQDWNREWEKNYFTPIVIAGRCVIHSSFHKDVPKCELDLVIDPKMAFGTGHHATTSQMATALLDTPLAGAKVIDMGTGTGILAMIASAKGAANVTAVEIDPVAAENAKENFTLNSLTSINLKLGDVTAIADEKNADILLANINRNIVIADMQAYSAAIAPGGTMLLSGFYTADIPLVQKAAEEAGLTLAASSELNDWACLRFRKNL